MERQKKTPFIFRGDLRSQTGYGRATRSLAELIPDNYDVYGVDLHHNPADGAASFPGRLIADEDILRLASSSTTRPIVFTYSDPDHFHRFPGVFHLGGFYWETASIPRKQAWATKCQLMDAFWAPTPFIADCIRAMAPDLPIDVLPWPHDFGAPPLDASVADNQAGTLLTTLYTCSAGRLTRSTMILPLLRRMTSSLALAVQSLAPRKGLPILLSEWGSFCRSAPGDAILLLKLSFRHATTGLDGNPYDVFETMLRRAGIDGSYAARVALVEPNTILTDVQMQALYHLSDVYVCASFGEGFGGPVIESLKAGRPSITPRHTGLEAMIPENYPLTVEHTAMHVGLAGNVPIYPLESQWNIPVRSSIEKALLTFRAMSPQERAAALQLARTQAESFCDREVVRNHMADSLTRLETLYAACS